MLISLKIEYDFDGQSKAGQYIIALQGIFYCERLALDVFWGIQP